MAKQTTFTQQKSVLERFLFLLTQFENDFKLLINKFDEDVSSLYENEGLLEEMYKDYKVTYLNSLNATLSDISTRIHDEDIPFIEKEIKFISSR